MKHSVTFGDGSIVLHGDHTRKGFAKGVNTWEDWHLIPSSRPEIVPPEVYTNYVDLPAAHGKLDLSEYLTGGPVYKNRTGSLEFYPENGHGFWAERYNQICNFLHGKKLYMTLDDEPEYFYHGRFKVQKFESTGSGYWSTVVIDYELDPFKFLLPQIRNDDVIWDRFLFEDIHGYRFMRTIDATDSTTFSIPGYTHGFMLDGFIIDSSTFPADVTVTLNTGTLRMTRQSASAKTVKTYSSNWGPVVNSSNTVRVTGTGRVTLFCWGGEL